LNRKSAVNLRKSGAFYLQIFLRAPAVIPRLAWHSRLSSQENAPRSCCCSGFSLACRDGQGAEVVSAMNRSGSAISSSIAQ
jgi:hypothetical protein